MVKGAAENFSLPVRVVWNCTKSCGWRCILVSLFSMSLIYFNNTWIVILVSNEIFIFLIFMCERKMMARGIRPTRNTFRGVKKDMLQRQTTLYLQNMTVSFFFLHKKILLLRHGVQCLLWTLCEPPGSLKDVEFLHRLRNLPASQEGFCSHSYTSCAWKVSSLASCWTGSVFDYPLSYKMFSRTFFFFFAEFLRPVTKIM